MATVPYDPTGQVMNRAGGGGSSLYEMAMGQEGFNPYYDLGQKGFNVGSQDDGMYGRAVVQDPRSGQFIPVDSSQDFQNFYNLAMSGGIQSPGYNDPHVAWAARYGLTPVMQAVSAYNANGTPLPPGMAEWLASQAGGASPTEQWNNLVASMQDKVAHGGDIFGINGLDASTWELPISFGAAVAGGVYGAGGFTSATPAASSSAFPAAATEAGSYASPEIISATSGASSYGSLYAQAGASNSDVMWDAANPNYLTGEGVQTGMGPSTGSSTANFAESGSLGNPYASPIGGPTGFETLPYGLDPITFNPLAPAPSLGTSASSFDLGGGLGVDEFGNVSGGMFEGGPGTPGAFDYAAYGPTGGGAMDWFWKSLKNNPFGWANVAMGGLGLYNANRMSKANQGPNGNARAGDPFASQRPVYQGKLKEIMDDPTQIQKVPGYQAGLDAVERKMASQGYIGSGNMMLAMAKYGGDFYSKYVDQLMKMAGVDYSSDAGRNLMKGQEDVVNLYGQGLNRILYGSRDIYNG